MAARLTAYFFLTLMLLKACVMPVIYLDFELRRDYIVKNLCVNRNRPELKCDGKCYLAKRIAAAREKDERQAERSFVFQLCETLAEPVSFSMPGIEIPAIQGLTNSAELTPYSSSMAGRIMVSGIFHPPLAA